MTQPVLVVHGVAVRDRAGFESTVSRLNQGIGDSYRLVPVFWGDLGAQDAAIEVTVPPSARGLGAADAVPEEAALAAILSTEARENHGVRTGGSAAQVERITQTAQAQAAGPTSPGEHVRGAQPFPTVDVREAVASALSATRYLRLAHDPVLLDAVGQAIGIGIRQSHEPRDTHNPHGVFATRGGSASSGAFEEVEDVDAPGGRQKTRSTRSLRADVAAVVGGIVQAFDAAAGSVIGGVLGQANAALRRQLGPGVARFLGDAFVYSAKPQAVHSRLWQAIEEHAPGSGTPDRPICVLAHSLGGLVAVDAALDRERPLWMRTLVTFGSQPSFFHILDSREGLDKFALGRHTKLPPSIGDWINLWEPLDALAFVMSPVFQLHSGEMPRDVPLQHAASAGLYTHSDYWTMPSVAGVIRQVLDGSAAP